MSSRIFRAASTDKKGDDMKKSKYDRIRAAFGLEKSKASTSGSGYTRIKPQISSFRVKGENYFCNSLIKTSKIDSEN